jgi:hypothetical protein
MQEYCKSDRGSNEEWMNITKERVKQSLTQNGEIGPKTIQDLRQNQTSTTKSNVNNVLGKNSQMASSVVNIVFLEKQVKEKQPSYFRVNIGSNRK